MIFEVKNGCFGYGKGEKILNDVNFTVEGNQVLTILGANGVGKTTLIKCMLGLHNWSSGATLIDGVAAKEVGFKEFWKKIGYVPQAKLSAFVYTVEEMVLLGRSSHLKVTELPNEKDKKIVHDALKSIGIYHLRHKLCSQISGGELQMVLIARALASEPSMLVLDEPESNLDFKNQLIVLNTIKELSKTKDISFIVNTHYPEHAVKIADKAIILRKDGYSYGKIDEIMTEESMGSAFGVNVKITQINVEDKDYTCVLPISLID